MSEILVQMPYPVEGTSDFLHFISLKPYMIRHQLYGRNFYEVFCKDQNSFPSPFLLTKVNDVFVHFPINYDEALNDHRFSAKYYEEYSTNQIPITSDTFPNHTIFLGEPILFTSLDELEVVNFYSKYTHHLYVPVLEDGTISNEIFTRFRDKDGCSFWKMPYLSYSARSSLKNDIPFEKYSEHRVQIPEGEVVSVSFLDWEQKPHYFSVYMAPGLHDYRITFFPIHKEQERKMKESDFVYVSSKHFMSDEEWAQAFQRLIEGDFLTAKRQKNLIR